MIVETTTRKLFVFDPALEGEIANKFYRKKKKEMEEKKKIGKNNTQIEQISVSYGMTTSVEIIYRSDKWVKLKTKN